MPTKPTTKARQRGSSIQRVESTTGTRFRFRLDTDPDPLTGARRQRTYTYATEAEAIREQTRLRQSVAEHVYVQRDTQTLTAYLDEWLEAGQRSWKPSTRDSYRRTLAQVQASIGSIRLQSLRRGDVERFVTEMLSTGGREGLGRKGRTVQVMLVVLHKALKDAKADGLVASVATEHVRRPRVEHTEFAVWTGPQMSAFLESVEDDRLVGLFALSCRGLRRGEVLGLRWGDVDFTRGRITIRNTRVPAAGQVIDVPPKTARGRRTVPLDGALAAALRRTYASTVLGPVRPLRPEQAYVAVNPAGEPLSPGQYNHEFTRLTARSGLPRIRLHDLRHSAATLLIEQGQPIPTVARMLGHDPAMTARVYAHVTDTALDSLSATFAGAFA